MSQNILQMLEFDVLIFGDENVGKSTILDKCCGEDYEINSENQSLRGKMCNKWCKIVELNDQNIKFAILEYQNWAIIGLLSLFFSKPYVIIFCYDITNRKSFKSISLWVSKLDEKLIKNLAGILIGNKCDLSRERRVSYNEGKKLAKKLGLFFMETSAEYSKNIDEIFNISTRIASYSLNR